MKELSRDTRNIIFSHIARNDLLALRATCRTMDTSINRYWKKRFGYKINKQVQLCTQFSIRIDREFSCGDKKVRVFGKYGVRFFIKLFRTYFYREPIYEGICVKFNEGRAYIRRNYMWARVREEHVKELVQLLITQFIRRSVYLPLSLTDETIRKLAFGGCVNFTWRPKKIGGEFIWPSIASTFLGKGSFRLIY